MSSLFLAAAILLFLCHRHVSVCQADVGTAASYARPYVPTACYGSDETQIPSDNMLAAASDRIWDNGAACGRDYLVRCLSGAAPPNPCVLGQYVKVTIVDQAPPLSQPSSPGTTLVLTVEAFSAIADPTAASQINIEFLQA